MQVVPEQDIIADRLDSTAPRYPTSSGNYTDPHIDVPKGVEPPVCDCPCHNSSILRNNLIFLEEKIGSVACVECVCWKK